MLAGNRCYWRMASLLLPWLMSLPQTVAAAGGTPMPASLNSVTGITGITGITRAANPPDAGHRPILPASEAEIAKRIAVLQAERERRLAALLPPRAYEAQASPGSTLLADPRTWMIGLSVMLALSLVCLIWLFLMVRRIREREWQGAHMNDWDEQMSRRVANPQPATVKGEHFTRINSSSRTRRSMPEDDRFRAELANPTLATPTYGFEVMQNSAQLFEQHPAVVDAISVIEETEPYHQAEFWVALGKPQMAIEILEQNHEHDSSPHGRLLLFDLYRQTGAHERYETLRQHCQLLFNAHIPAWDEAVDNLPSLKDRPDLMQRINRALADHNVLAYLEGLLFDNRGGTRYGFELGVYRDLVRLFDAVYAGKNVNNCEMIVQ